MDPLLYSLLVYFALKPHLWKSMCYWINLCASSLINVWPQLTLLDIVHKFGPIRSQNGLESKFWTGDEKVKNDTDYDWKIICTVKPRLVTILCELDPDPINEPRNFLTSRLGSSIRGFTVVALWVEFEKKLLLKQNYLGEDADRMWKAAKTQLNSLLRTCLNSALYKLWTQDNVDKTLFEMICPLFAAN